MLFFTFSVFCAQNVLKTLFLKVRFLLCCKRLKDGQYLHKPCTNFIPQADCAPFRRRPSPFPAGRGHSGS